MLNMIQKIKILLLSLGLSLIFVPALASAATDPCDRNGDDKVTTQEAIQCGADNSAGVPKNANPSKTIDTTLTNVIDVFSLIVAIAAILVIIYAGFKYITATGDQEGLKTAKNSIIYAVVGLIIVAIAQAIVAFVVGRTTKIETSLGQPKAVDNIQKLGLADKGI